MDQTIIQALIKKGVNIPNPESVYISNEVKPDRISHENVTIYAGCKIIGARSLISRNCTIGYEAPVTLEDTLLGENTRLNGGYFNGAVFLGGNLFASGAHVRQGTILEEEAKAAHTVALKQTILFPFVTLGSLINFCDCFMSGGTDHKNHSEVGSSFIHFNYTPNQDKATPSMMGNVCQGVLLNSKPIFLGGQGGLVGPAKIGFGCISAAGSIIRKSELKEDRLLLGGGYKDMSLPRQFYVYKNITPVYNLNIEYIAGLIALKSWYAHIRPLFITDRHKEALIEGLKETLNTCIKERVKRLIQFSEKLDKSKNILIAQQSKAKKENPEIKNENQFSNLIMTHEKIISQIKIAVEKIKNEIEKDKLNDEGRAVQNIFKEKINRYDKDYLQIIKKLSKTDQEKINQWLRTLEMDISSQLKMSDRPK